MSSPEHLRHIDDSFESSALLKRMTATLNTRSYRYKNPSRSFTVLESIHMPHSIAYQSISSATCVLNATILSSQGANTVVTILTCHTDPRLEVTFTKLQKLKSFIEEFSTLSARPPPTPSLYSSGKLVLVSCERGRT
jgi:hypothetical protein